MTGAGVELRRQVKIPLRGGLHLNATIYTSTDQSTPAPCIVSLTPYTADHLHDRGVYFAKRGLPFVAIDVRGRGDSQGEFYPHVCDAEDGYDAVEWLARQPFCNGKVGMYGGSYLGSAQWATASRLPPHLATIAPTAAPFIGVDTPMRKNIFASYEVRWLTLVSGRACQAKVFADEPFWLAKYREGYESGRPFRELDTLAGAPSAVFQDYLDHPERGAYWDAFNPTAEEYARMELPILTITGIYDGDQPGALEHYRQHLRQASPAARSMHYLIVGPWNHSGCTTPSAEFDGLKIGPAAMLDMYELHAEWYAWTLQGGSRPEFLKNSVAYYVMGAERWRYAATLEGTTARLQPLYLRSTVNPTDVFTSGGFSAEPPIDERADHYIYDPRDGVVAQSECMLDSGSNLTDQRRACASPGRQLVYHTAPFEKNLEVTGFFRLLAWLSIDQPDTDFRVWIHAIDADGASVLLTMDSVRARYREGLREARLITTREPLRYEFDGFTFVSRLIRKGHRLRLILGPIDSIHEQKNYNSGGAVAEESMADARPVTVRLFHDTAHPSVLYVPVGHADSSNEPGTPDLSGIRH